MSVQQVPPACAQTSYTLAPGLPCGVHWHMYTHQYECIRTHMYAYFTCYGVRGKEGCAAADAPEDAYFPAGQEEHSIDAPDSDHSPVKPL